VGHADTDNSRKDDEKWMAVALEQAHIAEGLAEVPIGAVIVKEGEIIAKGYNRREIDGDPLAHAELIAIKEASEKLAAWRLSGCTLYVTLEPCPMCAGAIVQSRIETVVFGTPDPKAGCVGSLMNLLQDERLNHQVQVIEGVLQQQCSEILKSFFRKLRLKKQD
jgi:tRNA(adenine34) deaminase